MHSSNIHTLVPDIYQLIKEKKNGWFSEQISNGFSEVLRRKFREDGTVGGRRGLRLSQMGPKCPRALWYSIHHPELAEPLPPWAEIKYAYGHVIEALTLSLCKAAGHDVQGEQSHVELDGIVGHRDAVVDGCVLDVKSSATRSFQKFVDGSISTTDHFGYLDQLDGYVAASLLDPLVTVKDRGYLLVIDKQLGHMVLYEHKIRRNHILERISSCKRIVACNEPPRCECGSVNHGTSGNLRLDLKASYSPYKFCCNPELRTFVYADGPVFLTRVVRKPDVMEIDRYGNRV